MKSIVMIKIWIFVYMITGTLYLFWSLACMAALNPCSQTLVNVSESRGLEQIRLANNLLRVASLSVSFCKQLQNLEA